MVQNSLRFKHYREASQPIPDVAEIVGLTCDDEMVTLRFMAHDAAWGRPARQVRLKRVLAEQLSRLLNDELEDASWR